MRPPSCGPPSSKRRAASSRSTNRTARTAPQPERRVASLWRCKFAGGLRFPGISLCGGHLLGDCVVGFVVSDAVEPLAVELGEPDAVGLVSDEEIEDGPDEGEAAVLAGEPTHHLRAPFDFAE